MYGDQTNYSEYLVKSFDNLNLSFFKANNSSIEDFLNKIDILIVQNQYEGFCRPIIVALKMGKLVIAPRSKVYSEFYKDCLIYYENNKDLIGIMDNILESMTYQKESDLEIINKRNKLFDNIKFNSNKGESVFLECMKILD